MTRPTSVIFCLVFCLTVFPVFSQETEKSEGQKDKQEQKKKDQTEETKAERRKRRKAERKKKQEEEAAKQKSKADAAKKNEAAKKRVVAEKKKKAADKKKLELTLENLFPEKSMFGSRASRPAFSSDGRYAAYLYRPRIERRHGSDLWLYDFEKKTNTRLTNVVMMSSFQKSARKVKEDRLDKAKPKKTKSKKDADEKSDTKAGEKKDDADANGKDEKKKELSEKEVLKIVTKVSDKDADAEKDPRYSGISSFTWHPEKNAMLLTSEGDVYQVENVADPKLVRLTKTNNRESRVDYLPDGSGFTYGADDAVHRVRFGQHMVEQINPRLSGGLELGGYEISPDGKRLVLIGRSGRRPTGGRTVDYIRYRDRFAKASSVPRTVSDDKTEPRDVAVFLYELDQAETEEAELVEVFRTKIDEPRDVISSPEWAPDSSKVTFCFFDQKNSEVQILLGEFPEENEDDGDKKKDSKDGPKKNDARVVYRFQHFGGPNTPRMVSPQFAYDSHRIAFVSEQSGFRHVHMVDPLYESVQQLTNGHFEVYPQRMSKDHRHLFVTATKDSSAQEMVYSINLETSEVKRISKEDGTYSSVAVSNDGKRLLSNFVTYGKLTELIRQDDDQQMETLTDSHTDIAKHFTKTKPEFFHYRNRHGHTIKAMMIKPDGWKKDDKHPLLIYVYGGPLGTRKSVVDGSYSSSAYFFNLYMAKKHGYLTVVIDPRGQSGYGGVFEKANYEQVGKPQVEDLVDGVKHLTAEYNVDEEKVGIYGWSFGGFQTQMCLYTAPDVFKVGMAGAGPTEWENYNSWYATGTIGPSGTDKPDQKKYSLLPLAKKLKGQLLLVHGMEDTNVLFQDTVKVYRELLKAGKETHVELFLDPTGSHGLGGDVKRLNRYRKYEEFLLRTMGSAKAK
ncbi:MAG: prolyl oligopeptidase family serine peptidase [Planctomycetaceae bacterium]